MIALACAYCIPHKGRPLTFLLYLLLILSLVIYPLLHLQTLNHRYACTYFSVCVEVNTFIVSENVIPDHLGGKCSG